VSLLTIAGCLVLLVIRTFFPQQGPSTTAPAQVANPQVKQRLDRPSSEPPKGVKVSRTAPVRDPDSSEPARAPTPDGLSLPREEALPAPRFAAAVRPVAPSALPSVIYDGELNYGTSIRGTVRLKGSAPPETTFDTAGSCSLDAGQPLSTRFFATDPKGGLADTVVFVSAFSSTRHRLPVSLTNQLMFTNCQLEPYINCWTENQALSVVETSGLAHTLRIKDTYGRTKAMKEVAAGDNLLLYSKLAPDFITMTCDIHPWEFSSAAVFTHPFFAMTDAHGEFTITNVPPGKCTVQAIHHDGLSRRSISSTEVSVRQRQKVSVDFTLSAPSK